MDINVIFSYIEKFNTFSLLHFYYNLINIALMTRIQQRVYIYFAKCLRYQGKDVCFKEMTSKISFKCKNFIIKIQLQLNKTIIKR